MGTGQTCDVFMFIASCDETRTQTPTAAFPEKPAKKVRDFDVFTYGSVVRLHRNASRAVRLQLPFRRGPRPDAFPERVADLVPPRTYFVPDGVVGVCLEALRRHRHRFVLSMFVSPRPLAPTFKGSPTGFWVFSRKREYLLANTSDRRREWASFAASTVTKIWGRRLARGVPLSKRKEITAPLSKRIHISTKASSPLAARRRRESFCLRTSDALILLRCSRSWVRRSPSR